MKQLFLILFIFVATTLTAQVAGEEYTVKKFGWTITIPEGFEKGSDEYLDEVENKGVKLLQKHIEQDLTAALDLKKTLLTITSDAHNMMEVIQQPHDPAIDGKLEDSNKEVAKLMAEALEKEMPGTVVTTKFSTEVIGGKTFYKTTFIAKYSNGGQFVAYSYNRLFNKTEFCINIMYINPLKGLQMVKALKASTFK